MAALKRDVEACNKKNVDYTDMSKNPGDLKKTLDSLLVEAKTLDDNCLKAVKKQLQGSQASGLRHAG